MTAEIAVLNASGAALAADSAVTVSRGAGKIYQSADKMFQLSLNAPVGIMVYGNAGLLGVPWETVIKCYRMELSDKVFPKLEDYGQDFLRFLRAARRMFPKELQDRHVSSAVESFFSHMRDRFKESVEASYHDEKRLTPTGVKRMFANLIADELRQSKKWPALEEMTPKRIAKLRSNCARAIGEMRKRVFEKLPMSQYTARRIIDLAVEVLTRQRLTQSGLGAGVVIAGFGEAEHFPELISFQVLGIAADVPLYFVDNRASIKHSYDAVVVPLAQHEMVWTFMEGIDPDLQKYIEKSTGELLHQMASIILAKLTTNYPKSGSRFGKQVEQAIDKLVPHLYNEWRAFRRKQYTDPVMNTAASLPKDELAAMAEALVNLTRFKRRISSEPETVGGPIDVAVITKGDGFVWTKRKHYFAPELNPRYMARAMRRQERS